MRMGSFPAVDYRDLEMAGGKNSASGTCGQPEFGNSDEDVLPASCSQNFSIRDYVSMVRSSDIKKNWPFSQKYLQVCLDNGRKPVLPPFEHPQSVRDLIQEKVKLEAAAAIHGSGFDRNDGDTGAKDTGNRFFIRIPAKRTHAGQKNNRKLGREKPIQSLSVTSGDQDAMTRACRSQVRNGCEGFKTKTEEDEEMKAQASEDCEMPKAIVAGISEEEDNQGSKPIADKGDMELATPLKTERKDKGSPESVEQESGHKLPNSEASSKPNSEISSRPNSEICFKARRKRTERPEILSDIKNRFLKRSKQSNRMLTFEMKSQELIEGFQKEGKEVKRQEHHHEQSRADSARNENLVNSGSSVTDGIMMVKVCPVCRTFSSASNTALNAHIDHCLAVEPNALKAEIKLAKNKTKVRKKRSMADICAVAPSRTLEDLIFATTQQLDPLQLDVSKWNGSSIRRGHRTPLSRAAKRHFDYADPNPKKPRNSSVLKADCLPHLAKESHKEPSVSGDRDKESYGTRRSRRSAFRNMTRSGRSLGSLGLDRCHDKVPTTSAVKHISNEGISQRKSQHASEEIIREEKLPSSVYSTSWACFNKQGSSKEGSSSTN